MTQLLLHKYKVSVLFRYPCCKLHSELTTDRSLNQKHYNILIYLYKYKYTALLHKKGPYETADEDADLK